MHTHGLSFPTNRNAKKKNLLDVTPVLQKTHDAASFKGVATLLDANRICHHLLCYWIYIQHFGTHDHEFVIADFRCEVE